MFTELTISASIAVISASASSSSSILILLFQKAQNMMQFPEDMATMRCSDLAQPIPIWLGVNSWQFRDTKYTHESVNYSWGHVITRFSSSSVREDGLADFNTNSNRQDSVWFRWFAAADTHQPVLATGNAASFCSDDKERHVTICKNPYPEKSIYALATAVTTTSEHPPWQMHTWALTYMLQQGKLP